MPEKKYVSDNPPLLSMLIIGAIAVVIGLILFTINTPETNAFEPDPGPTNGQIFGASMASFGTLLLVTGWAVAAILRHFTDVKSKKRIPH